MTIPRVTTKVVIMKSYHTPDYPEAEAALLRLGDEVSLCHFRINAMLEVLHEGEQLAPSLRGVLRNLLQNGPMTVPAIANLRPVSRQFIQKVVNELEAQGLVGFAENPMHRRSKLVRITRAGKARLNAMYALEAEALRRALERTGATTGEVKQAASLLGGFRRAMDEELAEYAGQT